MARNADLDAKLIEDPTDVAAHLVYADFLQSNGDPRGELIALQNAGKTKEAEAHLEKHRDALYGPLWGYRKTFEGNDDDAFEWRLGFIRSARFGYDSYAVGNMKPEAGVDVKETSISTALKALLEHPSGMLLEELTITINMLDDGGYFGPAIQTLAEVGAPALRSLRVGEFSCAGGPGGQGDYEYEISWTSLGDASALWKALPRLEKLVIQSGLGGSSAEQTEDVMGEIDLPKLKHLEVITGGMGKGIARSIVEASWPSLERMDLWFGDDGYGGDVEIDDIEAIFEGSRFPKLKRLGIMNAHFTDEVCARIGRAAILPRLSELSLGYGTMSDAGANALVASAAALKHLKRLELNDNCLSPDGVAAVSGLCADVDTSSQKGGSGDDRYVSLSE
jgi:uncharacterized protein (TIGR02996 family)